MIKEKSPMKPRTLALLGLTLAVIGGGFLVAPIIWPNFYRAWYGPLIQFDTNGIGFGGVGIGATLLAVAVLRLPAR
jgi:hypothetical protein